MIVAKHSTTRLGRMLREIRMDSGLTLAEMSERTGLGVSYLSRIETGQLSTPKPAAVGRLARGYGIDPDELIFADWPDPGPPNEGEVSSINERTAR